MSSSLLCLPTGSDLEIDDGEETGRENGLDACFQS